MIRHFCGTDGELTGRMFLPALGACAGGLGQEAALDCAYVSHADDSTIGSNFCQPLIQRNSKENAG